MAPRILVALDGSDHAEKALDQAIALARSSGGELSILNVVSNQALSEAEQRLAETEYAVEVGAAMRSFEAAADAPEIRTGLGSLVQSSHAVGATVRRVLGQEIVAEAAELARSKGVAKVSTAVEHGDAASVIIREAGAQGAELVVLGCRGLGDIAGLLLGSVSHKVAHGAGCSVLIVR
jgi:nucleotide-binding universal stress UspA family protein